jgi:outer membrane protein TolC
MYDNGFVEKIDVDRLEVQFNNLKFEQDRVNRLQELGINLLKFQMGVPLTQNITLTDSLYFEGIENFAVEPVSNFDYNQRIEYSLLQTQKELAALDIRNNRAQYLPQLAAFGTFGYNPAASKFSNLFDFKERWYDYSLVGLQLNVPIFDGLSKHFKTQQARLAYEKTDQNMNLLQNSIDLEMRQASINLTNSLDALKSQKRNLELASEVLRVSRIKYQQGVGSNIEVNNAITSYKEAETNFYSALYDALIAKVDMDKATGKLSAE